MSELRARKAAEGFDLHGEPELLEPWGRGLIHDSWRCTTASGARYLLQRINTFVFPEPERLMENVVRVTEHLRSGLSVPEQEQGSLRLVPTPQGRPLLATGAGTWRCYGFIEGACTFESVPGPRVAREAGRAFGRFLSRLSDLPGETLHETLPGFHDTPGRLQALRAAVDRDRAGRVAASRECLEALLERFETASFLEKGSAPRRVTHNDTKVNNVLFDESTETAICVVDLDTVMPGLVAYDYGDLVRSTVARRADDRPSPEPVRIDLELLRALTEGFLGETRTFLQSEERDQFARAPEVLTYELALRFLTDHLEGDVYFRIRHPGDNLVRAEAQLELLRSLERERSSIEAFLG